MTTASASSARAPAVGPRNSAGAAAAALTSRASSLAAPLSITALVAPTTSNPLTSGSVPTATPPNPFLSASISSASPFPAQFIESSSHDIIKIKLHLRGEISQGAISEMHHVTEFTVCHKICDSCCQSSSSDDPRWGVTRVELRQHHPLRRYALYHLEEAISKNGIAHRAVRFQEHDRGTDYLRDLEENARLGLINPSPHQMSKECQMLPSLLDYVPSIPVGDEAAADNNTMDWLPLTQLSSPTTSSFELKRPGGD